MALSDFPKWRFGSPRRPSEGEVPESLSLIQTAIANMHLGMSLDYDLCKELYIKHPLGLKIVETPIRLVLNQKRNIKLPSLQNDDVANRFQDVWAKLDCDKWLLNTVAVSRIYGIATVSVGKKGDDVGQPLDYRTLTPNNIVFKIFDPLTTAGDYIMNQDVLADDFQLPSQLMVNGVKFHKSRYFIKLNEMPIYLAFENSSIGFSGRSVFQRIAYPLMSYLKTLEACSVLAEKAGAMILKMGQFGARDKGQEDTAAMKGQMIKSAIAKSVVVMGQNDDVAAFPLQDAAQVLESTRRAIVNDIAAGDAMPSKLLSSETFATGFGEGTEDAKQNIRYLRYFQKSLELINNFFTRIVQDMAWDDSFCESQKELYPKTYKGMGNDEIRLFWRNEFTNDWASLHESTEEERSKIDELTINSLLAFSGQFIPLLDDKNKEAFVSWIKQNLNGCKDIFGYALEISNNCIKPDVFEVPSVDKPPAPNASKSGSPKMSEAKEKVSRINRR